jgi:DNA-binding NarL/FixJ family response regulator
MGPKVISCVLLADRHYGLTEGVYGLLKTVFDTVVMVADEESLLESARLIQPVVAVVDLSLTPGGGLQLLKNLRVNCPSVKLILLSVHDEPSVSRLAIEAGMDGFVLKRAIATDLLPAVDAVLGKKRYVSAGIRNFEDHITENESKK